MIKNMMRAAAVAALALCPLATPASASHETGTARPEAEIDCPSGYVCIYPEINFGGQPWVRRAADGSVKDLPWPLGGVSERDLALLILNG
ncbi:peptidase inhibitor family I36 protein [Streptomyces sp. TG1A-8]|uniref:peptidase inhibitor family I36 protein n=1 Tax=Streptomyces sp. TG1A-8 TaxID=3051385 RepID=UPI00265BA746|nr:peptidase inhibitor family I36 protein [Streptomyces sp. TG1A-8]MDO0929997.1 peptidase inhibitor family I36 protein [Streptomyces sp. TG1A-8]